MDKIKFIIEKLCELKEYYVPGFPCEFTINHAISFLNGLTILDNDIIKKE